MDFRLLSSLIAILCFAAVSTAAEPVVIVIDNSLAMWSELGADGPKIVAVRRAMADLLASPSLKRRGITIGLRTAGGTYETIDDLGCSDSELVTPIAEADPGLLGRALRGLYPLGRRPIALAVQTAIDDLEPLEANGRLLIVTAGNDTCGGNLAGLIQEVLDQKTDLEIRVIGLGLDRETANAATLLVPTRNVTSAANIAAALRWALLIDESDQGKTRPLDLRVSHGNRPLQAFDVTLSHTLTGEATTVAAADGTAQIKVDPGVYNAAVRLPDDRITTVYGISIDGAGGPLEIDLPSSSPVTLAIDPEMPVASGTVYVQYWGAPEGSHAIAIADAGSDGSDWLTIADIGGATGEAEFRLPGALRELEGRFLHQLDGGGIVILGEIPITVRSARTSFDIAESVENRTPLVLSWDGPNLPGDHITISAAENGDETVTCISASTFGTATVTSPVEPGTYECRYVSAMGRVLAKTDIEVFEVLATLDFRTTTTPLHEIEVTWSGPAADLDFISLAAPGSDAEEYLRWAPVEGGNPIGLRAPETEGEYEIRYVRSADGEILAREPLVVAARELILKAPRMVRTGTRFEVRWRGTGDHGDFVVIAEIDSSVSDYLDWADTGGGSPLTLAAPFEPGEYEIRYISGRDLSVRARLPVRAR